MEALKKNEEIVEDVHTLFLVDGDGRLRFTVPIGEAVLCFPVTLAKGLAFQSAAVRLMSTNIQDRITGCFDKYNLLTLPVVDHEQLLIGVITCGRYCGNSAAKRLNTSVFSNESVAFQNGTH